MYIQIYRRLYSPHEASKGMYKCFLCNLCYVRSAVYQKNISLFVRQSFFISRFSGQRDHSVQTYTQRFCHFIVRIQTRGRQQRLSLEFKLWKESLPYLDLVQTFFFELQKFIFLRLKGGYLASTINYKAILQFYSSYTTKKCLTF